jgi:hypothetical protein
LGILETVFENGLHRGGAETKSNKLILLLNPFFSRSESSSPRRERKKSSKKKKHRYEVELLRVIGEGLLEFRHRCGFMVFLLPQQVRI